MAKDKKQHQVGAFVNLGKAIANIARAEIVNAGLKNYKPTNLTSPSNYLLAQLLGVDDDWLTLFQGTFTGNLNGALLVGVEEHPAVQLAQAMMVQRFGFIQDPTQSKPFPLHPSVKQKREWFRDVGYKGKQ